MASFVAVSTPIEPTKGDILFGRGGDVNKHPGNIRFREKARELAPSYEACGDSKDSNEEKYKVSEISLIVLRPRIVVSLRRDRMDYGMRC